MRNKAKEKDVLLAKLVKELNGNMYTTEPGPSLGEGTSKVSPAGATDFLQRHCLGWGGLIILGVVVMTPP